MNNKSCVTNTGTKSSPENRVGKKEIESAFKGISTKLADGQGVTKRTSIKKGNRS